jgi:hypothetical protein
MPTDGAAADGELAPGEGSRIVPDALTIDPEVTVYADEEDPLLRKLTLDTAHTPEVSAGDLDAVWDVGDSGEESVGGSMPTPDQDNIDELGTAAGVEFQDNEPLRIDEKLGKRDERRWELDPASAEDYQQRARELADKPRPRGLSDPRGS